MNRIVVVVCVVAVVLAGSSGCMTKRQHVKAMSDVAAAQSAADAKHAEEIRLLQEQFAAEQAKVAALDARVATLQEEFAAAAANIVALEEERAKLQSDLAKMIGDKTSLQGSVDDMKQALAELSRRKAESDQRLAEFRKLLDRFKTLIDAGKLKVKMVDGRMVVTLATDVLFSSGSATLSKEGVGAVQEVGKVLASIGGRKFQIEGHTDNVPIKTPQFPSNWELASARSLTVLKTMVDAGMPAGRISAASFGESRPAAPNETSDGRSSNRRIEIVVVPDLSSLPGFDELNRAASKP